MQWPGLIRASVSTRRRLWHGQLRVAVGGHLATTTVGARCSGLAADLPSRRASCWLRSCREAAPRAETVTQLLKSPVTLWQSEPTLQRAALIQGCLFGSFSALWTILALQLDANCHLNAQIAGPFGVVGVLFAPIAGRLADRRVPYTVIRLSAIAMPAVVDDQENLSTR
jgi:hypothetical protein